MYLCQIALKVLLKKIKLFKIEVNNWTNFEGDFLAHLTDKNNKHLV